LIFDHPDFYNDLEAYKKAFRDFVSKLSKDSTVIANFDDEDVVDVVKGIKARVVSFGKNNAEFSLQLSDDNSKESKFYVFNNNANLGEFKLGVFGKHNILNSLAVIILGIELGIPINVIRRTLESFSGTERRAERKGIYNGALIYDDYAHHPVEIEVTLKAFRKEFGDNTLYCVFHPHSFSRTESLFDEFALSFKLADKVLVLDVYGSAREDSGNVNSKDLVEEINKVFGKDKALYTPKIDDCVEYVSVAAGEGDIVITMGAGDVWRVGEKLLAV